MKNILFIIFFSAALNGLSYGQKDTLYSLSSDLGLGYSRYITTLDSSNLVKDGFSGSLKIMWHPEHLLSIGFETGFQYLYSIESDLKIVNKKDSKFEAVMTSVPILFITSMRIFPLTLPYLELQGGGGVYLMYNQVKLLGSTVNSFIYSFGYHAGASYLQPLNNEFSIGGEFKYYYISKLQDADISLKIIFSYKFLRW